MLTIAQLETVYDTLAEAIDQAGAERRDLFLVKLALLQAQALGDEAADPGDQLLAVGHGVGQGVVPPDEQGAHAQVHRRHRLHAVRAAGLRR